MGFIFFKAFHKGFYKQLHFNQDFILCRYYRYYYIGIFTLVFTIHVSRFVYLYNNLCAITYYNILHL